MASADASHGGPLSGHVEIDETFVGGVAKGGATKRLINKTTVFAMLQRQGKIVAGPIPDVSAYTLEGIIEENVQPGSTISTDQFRGYNDLRRHYTHETVNHSANEYVRGIHHVNSLESHWSLFKRAVKGTHVHISTKHAWKYVAEFGYRRNMRHSHWSMFNLLVQAFALPRLAES